MDFCKVPTGFGMVPAINQTAMNAYSAKTGQQKQVIPEKEHHARSEKE